MTAADISHLRSTAPGHDAQSVTPNDSVDLAAPCRAFWVGTAGDVMVTTLKGSTLTIPNAAGLIPLGVTRIHATGTAGAGIVAFY